MESIEALHRSRHPSLLWKRIRPTTALPLDTTDDVDPLLPQRPLQNSYWATPILLASEYPADRSDEITTMKLTALLDVGIRDFYDLTEDGELQSYEQILESIVTERGWSYEGYGSVGQAESPVAANNATIIVRHRRFSIQDGGLPDRSTLHGVLQAIQDSASQDRKAVVHCAGGIGRTGTIVGCWLVQSGSVNQAEGQSAGQEALSVLKRKWRGVEKNWRAPQTPESAQQMAFVRAFTPI
ncbi:hypothetical protein FRB94_007854 [Tulasnella sp. JGI-2019a]|nr:hypothetical protein FRB93_007787 [Tulasnella sp. JGI-2019a]KAG8997121.1 hypothetical protein FRB94_007854 [Tulasnella sp. JGI-2019a]